MREFTPLAIVLGVLIGVLFGAANAYVGLKVGMTISASIPAAVISMGVLRGILRRGTILENNIVQTVGSAGESLAAGMIFTIPALLIFGFDVSFLEMTIWGSIGGLLGVLFMVPLRRALIVKEHGRLPYPEGVACAEVLESGAKGGASARTVFFGLGVGAVYELLRGLGFWREKAYLAIPQFRTAASLNASPALLGVGYILGIRIAGLMLAGGVLGWFVLIPLIGFLGEHVDAPMFPETATPISAMEPKAIHDAYVRYVGAGAVVFGGLLSLLKSCPTIVSTIWHALRSRSGLPAVERTSRDLPLPVLVILIAGLGCAMYAFPQVRLTPAGAICVLAFGFFFVTVSSRLVGLVGSSSNPASGMTIATILGTALIFVYGLHQTGAEAKFAAISVGAIVCIAVCIAGDCSQDLKTGFLLKATPYKQQIGELIGVLTATAAIAGVIFLLNDTYGFTGDAALEAPQANIMKLVVEGVIDKDLPWTLIVIGAAAALVVELLGIPSLPFAVGLYLPLYLTTPIMVGGVLRWLIGRWRRNTSETGNPGILGASGLVAGEGLMGVALAGAAALIAWGWNDPQFQGHLMDQPQNVVPRHFQPWLAQTLGFDPTYGLEHAANAHAADPSLTPPATTHPTSERSLFWFDMLPLAPFLLLVFWLAITAARRGRVPPGAGLPPDGSEGTPPPGPFRIGHKGPLFAAPSQRTRQPLIAESGDEDSDELGSKEKE